MTYMGKESKNKWIYTYVNNHFTFLYTETNTAQYIKCTLIKINIKKKK